MEIMNGERSSQYGQDGLALYYEEPEPDSLLTPGQIRDRDRAAVRRSLWEMPLQSAADLAATTGLSSGRVYQVLKHLRRHGLATRASLGRIGGVRHRWWLTRQGVLRTADELGRRIPWQVTEKGLRWLVRRLPALEAFYKVAPRLFSHPDVLTPQTFYRTPDPDEDPTIFTESLRMIEFQWMRDGEIHAVAHYENGAWVPLVWVGAISGTAVRQKAEAARGQMDDGLEPAGWVIICEDGLAATQASGAWTDDNTLVLYDSGETLLKMRPALFSWRPLRSISLAGDPGAPEGIVPWLQQDGTMLALNGYRTYRLIRFIAEWPGVTPKQLTVWFPETCRALLRSLRRAGLVVKLEGGFYLDRAGILAVAHMDRASWQSVLGRLGAYLKPDGVYRRQQARHNRAIVDVMHALDARDELAYPGWRAVRNIPGLTLVNPDLVVLKQRDDGRIEESFVEVEFTARAPSQIEAKLAPYRLVQQHTGNAIPCLFLVEDDRIRQRYASAGQGLIDVKTLDHFLTGDPD